MSNLFFSLDKRSPPTIIQLPNESCIFPNFKNITHCNWLYISRLLWLHFCPLSYVFPVFDWTDKFWLTDISGADLALFEKLHQEDLLSVLIPSRQVYILLIPFFNFYKFLLILSLYPGLHPLLISDLNQQIFLQFLNSGRKLCRLPFFRPFSDLWILLKDKNFLR